MTTEKLHDLMKAVFDEMREGLRERITTEEYQRQREEFAFHMTDWAGDLVDLENLCRSPESVTPAEAARTVSALLYHLVPHLTEAGNLLLDGVPNPFGNHASVTKD